MPSLPSVLRRRNRSALLHVEAIPQEPDDALDRETIAELSSRQVRRMSHSELARVIRSSPLPTDRTRLKYLDHVTLQRLAHLACLSCRNCRET
jgi:hypothetical protein